MAELNIIGAKEENRYFPYQQAFRVTRETMWQAGQDSWTDPPAQNPDLFQGLTNVEPVLQGNLQRRRGYTLFSNPSAFQPFNKGFAYRNEATNTRRLVWTSPTGVIAMDESGNILDSPIFIPSINASAVRMVLSRNFGYFADGIAADYLKWDGTVSAKYGPTAPASVADTGASWTGPNNVKVLDGVYASANLASSLPGVATSNLRVNTFSLGTVGVVQGIQADVYCYCDSSHFGRNFTAQLDKAGSPVGNIKSISAPFNTLTKITFGGPSDLWGTTWTSAQVNAAGFGAEIGADTSGGGGATNFYIDYIVVTVFTISLTSVTDWGIATVSTIAASTAGPNFPSTVTSTLWTNPANVEATDGVFSTFTVPGGGTPFDSTILSTNFGLSSGVATTSVISGVQVTIVGNQSVDLTGGSSISVALIVGGVYAGIIKTEVMSASTSTTVLGASGDQWGNNLTAALVRASNFGVYLYASDNNNNGTVFSIDSISVTVFLQGSAINVGAPGGGNITLLNGRVYAAVFQNSKTGTTSDIICFSSSTGPLTNNDVPLTNIPVSMDPQVDTVLLLATADGGDETTLYLLASLPNGTTSYTDNTPDALTASYTVGPTLLSSSIYQQTDSSGDQFGVANNQPPPPGMMFPVKHKGRIYGVVGPTLYFSKNLVDVTTSTTITTKWEEAWPPFYSLDISEVADTVTALLSDGQTLWIGSDSCIRQLIGDSPNNFQQPQVVFNETGVVNPDVWKIVFAEGQPVGAMWLTPDNRVMSSDFNSYQDVGTPIQDILNSINQTVVQATAHACFVSRGPSEYYMLYIATGIATQPNVVCVYNMRSKKWFVWVPTDTITCDLFNISANGTPQWLFATQNGPIYYWDGTVQQDRNNNTPVQYSVPIVTSWLDFGDMGLTKAFNKILVTTGDTFLTVGVQGANRDSELDSGGFTVLPPTVVQPEIFGDLFVPMVGQPGLYKFYQVTFTSPASTIKDVLEAFDFEIAPSMRM